MEKRIEWVDIAKEIAIISMIIGHEIYFGRLNTIIYSFHMPIFFILSDYTSHKIISYQDLKRKSLKMSSKIWITILISLVLMSTENVIFHSLSLHQAVRQTLGGIFWGSTTHNVNVGAI